MRRSSTCASARPAPGHSPIQPLLHPPHDNNCFHAAHERRVDMCDVPWPLYPPHLYRKSLAKERNLDPRGGDSGEAFRSFYSSDRCAS